MWYRWCCSAERTPRRRGAHVLSALTPRVLTPRTYSPPARPPRPLSGHAAGTRLGRRLSWIARLRSWPGAALSSGECPERGRLPGLPSERHPRRLCRSPRREVSGCRTGQCPGRSGRHRVTSRSMRPRHLPATERDGQARRASLAPLREAGDTAGSERSHHLSGEQSPEPP